MSAEPMAQPYRRITIPGRAAEVLVNGTAFRLVRRRELKLLSRNALSANAMLIRQNAQFG